jgi:Holliday junction resolvase RusA-like endonuclease
VTHTYVILGIPRSGKNSTRIFRAGNGRRFVKKSKAATEWLALATEQLTQQRGRRKILVGACRVDVIAYQARDACDLDNMVSLTYDALKGVVIADDKAVTCGWTEKRIDKARPRVEVTVRTLKESP